MHAFNATVRLQGSIGNEVIKFGLTVPEIIILQHIHGADAVTKLTHVGSIFDFDDLDERDRLKREYDDGLANLSENLKTSVEKIFGGEYNPLPVKMRGFKGPFVEEEGYLEDFQEPPYEEMEDVGITPMEKARERRAEAAKRALKKRQDAAAGVKKAPVKTTAAEDDDEDEEIAPKKAAAGGRGGKSAIDAAL